MSDKDKTIEERLDAWVADDSPIAAVVVRQWLVPVEGEDAVIFPPTYATPEGLRKEEWLGYNIDRFEDGRSVCQIDSVGSQANRMEPIFQRKAYRALVPKVTIAAGDAEVDLLEAGHRAADAIVRFSDLAGDLHEAFVAWQKDGNAEPLAKIAPTSLVFGAWDSRATQAKLPRIVRSVTRAYDVEVLHRSAQYIPPLDYVAGELLEKAEGKQQQDAMSEFGLSHAPAAWTHGGVLVRGEIRREAALNLVAVRTLGAGPEDQQGALKLRRYVLGLSLVCLTAPPESFLREGCQLVPDPKRPARWSTVDHAGAHEAFDITHVAALAYATTAAEGFGVGPERTGRFSADSAKEALGQSKEQRKAARRAGRSKGKAAGGEA